MTFPKFWHNSFFFINMCKCRAKLQCLWFSGVAKSLTLFLHWGSESLEGIVADSAVWEPPCSFWLRMICFVCHFQVWWVILVSLVHRCVGNQWGTSIPIHSTIIIPSFCKGENGAEVQSPILSPVQNWIYVYTVSIYWFFHMQYFFQWVPWQLISQENWTL